MSHCMSSSRADALLAAAATGDIEALQTRLRTARTSEINRPSRSGVTPLVTAALGGFPDCVRALCMAGAAVNQVTDQLQGITSLHAAAVRGHIDCARALLDAGAAVDQADEQGMTPLFFATFRGRAYFVRALCAAGASVNKAANEGGTPLYTAAIQGHEDCVRALCEAGAAVNLPEGVSASPLLAAAQEGHAGCTYLLHSYGARNLAAAVYAANGGHDELRDWLQHAHSWTPLHHLEVLTPARTLSLLRDGADLHAGKPSPLERAKVVPGDASALVLRAAAPWSPKTHHLFPEAARAQAVAAMRLGYQLAWSTRYESEACSLVDAWISYVLPNLVDRG